MSEITEEDIVMLSSICGRHYDENCLGCISAKESNDNRLAATRAASPDQTNGLLANKIAAAMQRARDEIGATEQQRIAFAYAEAAMRSALASTPTARIEESER